MHIRPFRSADETDVVDLWQRCDLTRPWNDPHQDIQRKLGTQPELFLIGERDGLLLASVMAGFDGHRGWVNYLAVDPAWQRHGLGRQLMTEVERRLTTLGCPKLNLQVRSENQAVLAFYRSLGYQMDEVVSLGKRLIADV